MMMKMWKRMKPWMGRLAFLLYAILFHLSYCDVVTASPEEEIDKEVIEEIEEPEATLEETLDFMGGIGHTSGSVRFQYGGRFVFDGIKYGRNNKRDSGFEMDTARFIVHAQYETTRMRFEPDLIGVDSPRNMRDAWVSWEYYPGQCLTAGQFMVASGTEGATREDALPLAGYGFTTYLNGRYDMGVCAEGDLLPRELWYSLTHVTGQGFGLEGRRRKSVLSSVRIVHHPFARVDEAAGGAWLNGLYWGAGLAYTPDFDDPIVMVTPFESTVFTTPDLNGGSSSWLHWEAGYSAGPFRIGGERIEGSVNNVPVGNGNRVDMDQLTAWSAYASFNFTGFEPEWEHGRWLSMREAEIDDEPTGRGRYGRWEMAARYSNMDLDRNLFIHGLTDYNPSTQEARTFSLFLNYYPVTKARIALGWVNTIADHELTTFGNTSRDSAFVLRLALNF